MTGEHVYMKRERTPFYPHLQQSFGRQDVLRMAEHREVNPRPLVQPGRLPSLPLGVHAVVRQPQLLAVRLSPANIIKTKDYWSTYTVLITTMFQSMCGTAY